MDEPMPRMSTMAMLYGSGGHLSTETYSLVRAADAAWRGTAVGRSRISVEGAADIPMKRAEWTLDTGTAKQLEDAISRRCPFDRSAASRTGGSTPPPRGYISERVVVVTPDNRPVTFYATEGDGRIAALIRPVR